MIIGDKAKGYILGIIAAATYGLNPLFALPLYGCGMTADSVLFFRYLFALPLLGVMIKMRGRNFAVGRKQTFILVALGLLVALSSLTLFLSYNYMSVGIASTLLFIYPVMVAVIMAGVFKERISAVTVLSISLALTGIMMLYKGDGSEGLSVTGTVLVMVSALSYAIYIVAINRTSLKEVATLKVTFYILLYGVALFAVRILSGGGLQFPSSDEWYLWGCVLGLAVLPTAVSFVCTTAAIQYIGSTPAAILGSLEPVTAVVIGLCVFGERLSQTDVIGILVIILAVLLVVGGPSVSGYLVHIRKLFPRIRRRD